MMKPQNSQKLKHKSDDARDELSQPIKSENQNQNLVTIASFNDADSDLDSPHQLSDVPIKYSLSPLEVLVAIKDHIFHNHQHNTLDIIPDQAAQVENEGQLHSNDSSLPDISTPSATRSMSSSTSTCQQYLSVANNKVLTGVLGKEKQNPVNRNSLSIVPVSKKTSPDGYNWRKYGEKKLKCLEGSRSYYRCTHCNCYAKKIECSDRNNYVTDTVYKSQHNHDPPNKVSRSPKIRPPAINGHSKTSNSSTGPNNAVASISLKTYAERRSSASSSKEQCRDGSDDKSEINVVDDDSDTDTDTDTDTDEVELRKRLKRRSDPDYAKALSKAGKKPKLIVRAAGDVVISGDGYRWRKYGQKMVKGNPHPRNYYRCTSAGCPVRKHIERAVDDPIAAIITYKGVHDHDMPIPKTRQGLPSALDTGTDVGSPVPLSSLQVKSVNNCRIKYPQPNGSGHSWQSEE